MHSIHLLQSSNLNDLERRTSVNLKKIWAAKGNSLNFCCKLIELPLHLRMNKFSRTNIQTARHVRSIYVEKNADFSTLVVFSV